MIIGWIDYNIVQRWQLHTPIPWSRNEADSIGLLQHRHQFQQLRLGSEAEITIENACASFEWSCPYPAHFFQRPSVVCFCILEKLIDIVEFVAVGARVNTGIRPNQPSMSSFRNWCKNVTLQQQMPNLDEHDHTNVLLYLPPLIQQSTIVGGGATAKK